MNPTQNAIKEMWKANFFRSQKTTNEAAAEALATYGCTHANWTVALKRAKFIRKKNGKWIQKNPFFESNEIEIEFIEAGKPRTAIKKFDLLAIRLNGEIQITDPYLTRDTLEILERFKGKNTKFLFATKETKLTEREITDFLCENPSVELRQYPHKHLHDRYIISSDLFCIIGHGLSLRNKETFIIAIGNEFASDTKNSLKEVFNRRWKESKEMISNKK